MLLSLARRRGGESLLVLLWNTAHKIRPWETRRGEGGRNTAACSAFADCSSAYCSSSSAVLQLCSAVASRSLMVRNESSAAFASRSPWAATIASTPSAPSAVGGTYSSGPGE